MSVDWLKLSDAQALLAQALPAKPTRSPKSARPCRPPAQPSCAGGTLTATYNLVNDAHVLDDDVVALRQAHVDLDLAVLRAYGWDDLDPQHGFYATAQGRRFTIGPAARVELLDWLLELNHERYAQEVAAGLHDKSKRGKSAKATPSKRATKKAGDTGEAA